MKREENRRSKGIYVFEIQTTKKWRTEGSSEGKNQESGHGNRGSMGNRKKKIWKGLE